MRPHWIEMYQRQQAGRPLRTVRRRNVSRQLAVVAGGLLLGMAATAVAWGVCWGHLH